MAPKKGNALKEVNMNVAATAVTPRREITALKQKNEALEATLANLTAQLEQVNISQPTAETAPNRSADIPVISPPDFRYLDASLPDAPARPASAFSYYSNYLRKTDELKHIKATEQSKIIGQKWKELSEEEKETYFELHERDKARYEQQHKKYKIAASKVEMEKKALMLHFENKKQEVAMQCYENLVAAQAVNPSLCKKPNNAPEIQAPKRPKSAFNIFCADRREQIAKTKNGEKLDLGESMKKFSAEWAKMNEKKAGKKMRAKYEDFATRDKERYTEEYQEYLQKVEQAKAEMMSSAAKELEKERKLAMKTYAPVVKAEAEAEERRKLAKKEKKEKKAEKELAPKRPKSAYILFTMAKREVLVADRPDTSQADLMAELGRMWKEATPDEKRPFEEQAVAEKERYAAEMEAYRTLTL